MFGFFFYIFICCYFINPNLKFYYIWKFFLNINQHKSLVNITVKIRKLFKNENNHISSLWIQIIHVNSNKKIIRCFIWSDEQLLYLTCVSSYITYLNMFGNMCVYATISNITVWLYRKDTNQHKEYILNSFQYYKDKVVLKLIWVPISRNKYRNLFWMSVC